MTDPQGTQFAQGTQFPIDQQIPEALRALFAAQQQQHADALPEIREVEDGEVDGDDGEEDSEDEGDYVDMSGMLEAASEVAAQYLLTEDGFNVADAVQSGLEGIRESLDKNNRLLAKVLARLADRRE